jgi:predicted nucleotidyltransferase
MDFRTVLEKLVAEFEARQIRYALMGGFALSLWGVPRATVDLDFLAALDDMGAVHAVLSPMGYQRVYHSENVSQYTSELAAFGEIDFIHAFRKASEGMLRRAAKKKIFGGRQTIRVLVPEDLMGLKVQAIANNPARRAIDLADIESLMELYGADLDWKRIEEYFELFDMSDLLAELEARYHVPR